MKSVSTSLALYFKLKVTMSPTSAEERECMTHAVGSLMYAIVCIRPDLSQVSQW